MTRLITTLFVTGFMLSSTPLWAQQDLLEIPKNKAIQELKKEARTEEAPTWQFDLKATTEYLVGSDIEGPSGEINVWSNRLRFNVGGSPWRASRLDVALSYENRQYDYDGGNAFFLGTNEPWRSVNTLGLSATLFQAFNESWGGLIQANIRASAEAEADLTDGLSGLIVAGVGHQFADNFRLGLGVTTIFRFEENPVFFPGFVLDWQINDSWRFAILGPQSELSYTLNDQWQFGLGVAFDGRRYRLNSRKADAIAQEFRIPLFLRARWSPAKSTFLEIKTGVDLHREFEISDRNGHNDRNFDVDPGFFIGLSLNHTF